MTDELTDLQLAGVARRLELTHYVLEVAEPSRQKAWHSTSNPSSTDIGLYALLDLIEEFELTEIDEEIRSFLALDQKEATAISSFARRIKALVRALGSTYDNDVYTRSKDWPACIEEAQRCLRTLFRL